MEISKLKTKEYNEAIRQLKQIYKRPKERRATKNPLSEALLNKHPELSEKELKLIKRTVLARIGQKNSRGRILDYIVPHIGRFRTHQGRKKTWTRRVKSVDRKRKRAQQREKQMTKEYLLF